MIEPERDKKNVAKIRYKVTGVPFESSSNSCLGTYQYSGVDGGATLATGIKPWGFIGSFSILVIIIISLLQIHP